MEKPLQTNDKQTTEKTEKTEKQTDDIKALFNDTTNNSDINYYYDIITNLKTSEKRLQIKNRQAFNKLIEFITDDDNIKNYGIKEYHIKTINDIQHKTVNNYNINGKTKTTTSYYYKPISEYDYIYNIVKYLYDNVI